MLLGVSQSPRWHPSNVLFSPQTKGIHFTGIEEKTILIFLYILSSWN